MTLSKVAVACVVFSSLLLSSACKRREEQASRTSSAKPEEVQPVAGREMRGITVVATTGQTHTVTDPALIRQVEEKLMQAGVNPGTIDGVADDNLKNAISEYQAKKGLHSSGQLDQPTTDALGLKWEQFTGAMQQK